jgi:hypothetical protein
MEKSPLGYLLPPQLIEELQSLSDKTNISVSELLEISVTSFLERMNSTTEPEIAGLNIKEMILKNKIIISQNKEVLNKD